MAQNKNALIRYRTIDKCLQNRYRTWTLDDLIEACSDALYEYEGRDVYVSKRTVQLDLQLMRSDKLGYNAPIEVYDKKFYRYADADFTITDIPLNENDMHVLSETVEMLKQFKDFSLFAELGGIIQRLEDKIYTEKTHQPAIIHLDKNDQLRGLEHLDTLYQAILKKMVLKLRYQSFKAKDSLVIVFHPFILKEYNNRWFLVGKKNRRSEVMTLALDRIISIDYDTKLEYINEAFDGDVFYKNTIGVTVLDERFVDQILIRVDEKNAPYVITKPLHHSQRVIETSADGSIVIALSVHQNFELERLIMGFGESMHVLKPLSLKRRIHEKFQDGLDRYNSQLSLSDAIVAGKKLRKNGYAVLNRIYTRREIRKIGNDLHTYFSKSDEAAFGKRRLLKDLPSLKKLLFNENLKRLVKTIDADAFLVKAIYFDKPQDTNWFVSWHQDVPINVERKIATAGFSSWTKKKEIHSVCPPDEVLHNLFTLRIHLDDTTEKNGALKVLPGTHTKRFSNEEINTIVANARSLSMEVVEGGVQLMKPLLLHASSKSVNQKRRRVIHLEFGSFDLPGELTWLEKEMLSGS